MSKPYISSAYVGAMASIMSTTPTPRRTITGYYNHTPKPVLKAKKKKRKIANKSRKGNRR